MHYPPVSFLICSNINLPVNKPLVFLQAEYREAAFDDNQTTSANTKSDSQQQQQQQQRDPFFWGDSNINDEYNNNNNNINDDMQERQPPFWQRSQCIVNGKIITSATAVKVADVLPPRQPYSNRDNNGDSSDNGREPPPP